MKLVFKKLLIHKTRVYACQLRVCHPRGLIDVFSLKSTRMMNCQIFCRLALFCLSADKITCLRIFFQAPLSCILWNLLLADDFEPYFAGSRAHLQSVISTNSIALIVVLSSALGLPTLACFGRYGCTASHCLSVNAVNFIKRVWVGDVNS